MDNYGCFRMQINLSVHVHRDLERVGFIIVDHLLVCAHSRFAAHLSEQEATYPKLTTKGAGHMI